MVQTEAYKGDIRGEDDLELAGRFMAGGTPIAVDNDAVAAVCGDGCNPDYIERVTRFKARDRGKPFGLTIPSDEFSYLIDVDRVHPDLQPLVDDPHWLTSRLGAMAFVRVPARKNVDDMAPPSVLSRDHTDQWVIQNYDPSGKQTYERLLDTAYRYKVEFLAVTSLNQSGDPEIVDPNQAVEFSSRHDIPYFADNQASRKGTGSYPIVEFNEAGVSLLRSGNIDPVIMRKLLSDLVMTIPVDMRYAAGTPLTLSDIPEGRSLQGPELRQAIIEARNWS